MLTQYTFVIDVTIEIISFVFDIVLIILNF